MPNPETQWNAGGNALNYAFSVPIVQGALQLFHLHDRNVQHIETVVDVSSVFCNGASAMIHQVQVQSTQGHIRELSSAMRART